MAGEFCRWVVATEPEARSRLGRRAALTALALSLGVGCSTDTAGLARTGPLAGGSGGAGAPGAPEGGAVATGGTGGSSGSSSEPQPDASGDGTLTIVHGLVDGGRLYVCLRDLEGGGFVDPGFAEAASGAAYAEGLRLPTTWGVAERALELQLFIAPDPAGSSPTCPELEAQAVDTDADVPGVTDAGSVDAGPVAAPFPLPLVGPRRAGSVSLPRGALRAGTHYALIAAGCTSPSASADAGACGPPDSLFGSRRGFVLAPIAEQRVGGADTIGLQFVNASRAVSRADVVLQNDSQRQSTSLGGDIPFGAVRPSSVTAVTPPIGVELHVERATLSSYTEPWSETLASAGAEGLASGQNYLLVYVGPLPEAATPGISPPRFVLVRGR
jgi:hypothetical protein